ncbi:putative membrane protein YphA (DoxX/SURF4 family) [Pedobacter sp. AK017]|uniref:MauE/DoxX family redox-associated membrane protein n=1 Tax=Pedobacter sp. AK017 TaxID=2723073 RepID=UPI0016205C46|nr:MauE/DoxX family redox-associated membrane protein [Pedobacter sp. AK017]MBB5436938.1 putative membrane protein YphA (DoxX/SURF4 family) [Pedobacter sp. AK017]
MKVNTLGRWRFTRNFTIELIAFSCALLFFYAAVDKLIGFELFKTQLGKSPLLLGMSAWLAWAVPAGELLICALLLFKPTRILGFYAFFFQMMAFAFYLIALLNFSFYVPCSCGLLISSLSWPWHVAFNIAFALLAAIGIQQKYSINNGSGNSRTPGRIK